MHMAARSGHKKLCDLFYNSGARGRITDDEKRLPSQIAMQHGHEELAKHLQAREEKERTEGKIDKIKAAAQRKFQKSRGREAKEDRLSRTRPRKVVPSAIAFISVFSCHASSLLVIGWQGQTLPSMQDFLRPDTREGQVPALQRHK